MIKNTKINDSGLYKVINYIEKFKRGTIWTVDDFKEINGLTYTNIRTILVNLCDMKVLIRVCRGVYCYPKIEGGMPVFPAIINVLSKLSEREHYEICPVGEYAEYLLGLRNTIPNNVLCYNNYKIKTINFENGISVKMLPSKKLFSSFIKKKELRMLIYYINKVDISKITNNQKEKLIDYYYKLDEDSRMEAKKTSSFILDFLGIK